MLLEWIFMVVAGTIFASVSVLAASRAAGRRTTFKFRLAEFKEP
jgi:hypothetical protein